MAGGTTTTLFPSPLVSHRRHRALPLFSTPPFLSSGRRRSPTCKPRPRTTSLSVKFSQRTNPVSSESPEAKPKPAGNDRDPELSSTPPAGASPSPFLGFITHGVLCQIWGDWRADRILLEIASIALPAMLALAADPLTSVVDTAFVGHLGSVELAAVGVSISVFNLVSKLFNVPLLNITTSFVAEEQASDNERSSSSSWHNKRNQGLGLEPFIQKRGTDGVTRSKRLLPAVSTSLVMAAGIGIAEAFALSFGSGKLMDFMGIFVDSPMRIPAVQFLTVRALGAPAIVIALAAQGTFRGFKDTKTPLYAIGAGNLLNAILDPILMFLFALGVEGAAIATVIADYLIAFVLLWKLNEEVVLIPSNIDSEKLLCYLKSGGLLIGRTFAVLGTMTLSTSLAARQGPIPMAAHQICLQVWLAISLLNDALALAGQALLASEFAKGNYKKARTIIYRVLQIGFITGLGLAVILLFAYEAFCGLFTTDSAVLEIAQSGLLFVTASQPINALAFVIDGLYYGVSDFAYAAYSMVLVGLFSSLLLLSAAPLFGLSGVWIGLFVFMTLRVAAGFWRLGCKTGPWQMIWSGMDGGVADE